MGVLCYARVEEESRGRCRLAFVRGVDASNTSVASKFRRGILNVTQNDRLGLAGNGHGEQNHRAA